MSRPKFFATGYSDRFVKFKMTSRVYLKLAALVLAWKILQASVCIQTKTAPEHGI